jgi:hypothetical protein
MCPGVFKGIGQKSEEYIIGNITYWMTTDIKSGNNCGNLQ